MQITSQEKLEAEQKLMKSIEEKQTEIAHQCKQLSSIKIENELAEKKLQEVLSQDKELRTTVEKNEAKF